MTQHTYIIYLREAGMPDPLCVFIAQAPDDLPRDEVDAYMADRYGARIKRTVLDVVTGAYADAQESGLLYAALNDCPLYPTPTLPL